MLGLVETGPGEPRRTVGIRLARPEEAEQIASLFSRTFGNYPASPYNDPEWIRRNLGPDFWASEQDTFVAVDGEDRVLGCAALVFERATGLAEIGRLFVDANAPRGIGKGLLEARLSAAEAYGITNLVSNAVMTHCAAQTILAKRGFVAVGVEPDYVEIGFPGRPLVEPICTVTLVPRTQPAESAVQVAPIVAHLAQLARKNLSGTYQPVRVARRTDPYPLTDCDVSLRGPDDGYFQHDPFSNAANEANRHIVNGTRITEFSTEARPSAPNVLLYEGPDGSLAELEFSFSPGTSRLYITGLYCQNEAVRGAVLRCAVEELKVRFPTAKQMIVDVQANAPQAQQTFAELGFRPTVYHPGQARIDGKPKDVVRMAWFLESPAFAAYETIPSNRPIAAHVRYLFESS